MAKKVIDTIRFEDMDRDHIRFRNFSGKPDQFNPAGRREFTIIIDDPELVKVLRKDGWNVREREGREEGEMVYSMKVGVNYNNIPPKIVRVCKAGQVPMNEETVGQLDFDEIKTFDLEISPYNWEVNGKSGVKGYVKTMYVVVEEDPFADKYTDFDDDDVPFDA